MEESDYIKAQNLAFLTIAIGSLREICAGDEWDIPESTYKSIMRKTVTLQKELLEKACEDCDE